MVMHLPTCACEFAGRQIVDGAWGDVRSLLSNTLALFAAAAALVGTATLLQPLRFFQPADFRCPAPCRLLGLHVRPIACQRFSIAALLCCRSTAGPLGAFLMRSYGANLLLVAPVMVTLKVLKLSIPSKGLQLLHA